MDASRNGYTMASPLFVVVFLALVTLADNILTNALPITLGSDHTQTPGFWNLITYSLIFSTISDLVGQLILIPAAYYGSRCAMNLNSLSVILASLFSLASAFWKPDGLAWIPAIAGVFKIIGGGSHATIFLAIVLIRKSSSGGLRTALIYTTGAVGVLCQTVASTLTPVLARRSLTLPYITACACCVLASAVTLLYGESESSASDRECANDPSTQPLLPHVAATQDPHSVTSWELVKIHHRRWKNKPSMIRKVLKSLGWIFLLAACAKATRPLFLTYILHRVGVSTNFAGYLWNVRIVMSLVIFIVILPLSVIVLPKYTPTSPNSINLYAAKVSVILLATGALLIGLARSKPVLISGLVINTLGVATDLALLAFSADVVADDLAGCFFMTIASLESVGTLVGIAALYPLYQSVLHDGTLFGGIPYYICTGLFTIAGIKVWRMKPLVTD